MLELYQSDGIIAEPAGALATARAGFDRAGTELGTVPPGSTVVCLLSGGNNDVSRYAEVVEAGAGARGPQALLPGGLPRRNPVRCAASWDDVLGPDDDITLFEYVEAQQPRETGPALVGIELLPPSGPGPRCWSGCGWRPHTSSGVPPNQPAVPLPALTHATG